jgi:predicted membrane protein
MDELELLKKDWKKQEGNFKELSYNEIYKIIHKKSSSIVKWIFIISIAEFVFWNVINFFIPDSIYEIYEKFNLKTWLTISTVIYYIIVIWFIYKFYKSFKAIHVADTTKQLMKKIIATRKIVNNYVYFAILFNFALSIVFTVVMFANTETMIAVLNPKHAVINEDKLLLITLVIQIVAILLMCGALWLYYRIIYGILLKKLTKNYNELKSLEL